MEYVCVLFADVPCSVCENANDRTYVLLVSRLQVQCEGGTSEVNKNNSVIIANLLASIEKIKWTLYV